jgi:hypothetical protein
MFSSAAHAEVSSLVLLDECEERVVPQLGLAACGLGAQAGPIS